MIWGIMSLAQTEWDDIHNKSLILQVKSLFKSLFQSMSNNNRDACLSKHCNYTANLGWIHTHKHIAGAAQACAERPLWERRKMRGSRYEKYRYTRRAGPSRPDQTIQTTQQAPTHTHTSLSNTLPQTQGDTFKRQPMNAPQSTHRNGHSGCRWRRVITQQCFFSRSTFETQYRHNC